jgi:hypothetical protein
MDNTADERLAAAERVIEAASELSLWGIEHDDPRSSYFTAQIDRDAAGEFSRLLADYHARKAG